MFTCGCHTDFRSLHRFGLASTMSTLPLVILAEPLLRRAGGSELTSGGAGPDAGCSGPTGAPGEVEAEAEALGEALPSPLGAGCVAVGSGLSGRTRTPFIVCTVFALTLGACGDG